METQKTQAENPPKPAVSSCRKKTKDDANFLEDVKDHIDEFINASMDDHKNCFNKTIKKVATFNPAVGSHVWVEDPDEAWLDGEVVEINGDQIKVLCTSGKQVVPFQTFAAAKAISRHRDSSNRLVSVLGSKSSPSFVTLRVVSSMAYEKELDAAKKAASLALL